MAVKQDAAKARYWQDLIREATRSGLSIREIGAERRFFPVRARAKIDHVAPR
jgi:hypothetical protein